MQISKACSTAKKLPCARSALSLLEGGRVRSRGNRVNPLSGSRGSRQLCFKGPNLSRKGGSVISALRLLGLPPSPRPPFAFCFLSLLLFSVF